MGLKRQFWKKFLADKYGVASLIVVCAFLLAALGVEIYSIYCDVNQIIPVYMRSDPANCSAPPALPRLRSAWFAARARVAYLAGDLPKAIAFQKQVAPANARGKDPVLEYFTGAEKLKKRLP